MKFSQEIKILRKMNFLSDQEGIINRYLSEKENWDPHLNNTKEFILRCLRNGQIHTVTILGSGWLLDVPLQEMNDLCRRIYLVDIVHPAQILHKVGKLPKVRVINLDITGGMAREAYDIIQAYKRTGIVKPVSEISSPGFIPSFDPGYIVSLNILNQLDILIIDYLKKFSAYEEQEILELRKKIQHSHLESLPRDNSCIVTDYKECVYNKDLAESEKPLVFIPLPDGRRRKTWEWQFDTTKTYYPGKKTIFHVVAIEL